MPYILPATMPTPIPFPSPPRASCSPHSRPPTGYTAHSPHSANHAGSRLPHIPRRTSATTRSRTRTSPPACANNESESDCATPMPASIPAGTENMPAVPGIAPRAQRTRGRHGAVFDLNSSTESSSDADLKAPPPACTVAFPTVSPARTSPPKRPLRINIDIIQAAGHPIVAPLPVRAHTKSAPIPAPVASAPLIRKKSGEVLKSSLKRRSSSTSARARPSLASLVVGLSGAPSISAPASPATAKAVHFDAQLEHVRLFLAEQKPRAVSRDGSPTADSTGDSGTEGEFPFSRAARVPSDDETARRALGMRVLNLRERRGWDADVKLESLVLAVDSRSAQGTIRVRNIAFEKWVAVRFTFDFWQTTSEVTARWIEACMPPPREYTVPHSPHMPPATFDRFAFTIRLSDMLTRLPEKTLFLAVRYTAAGSEMWDNNDGENYKAVFEQKKVPAVGVGMSELKRELEKVATDTEESTAGGDLPAVRLLSAAPPAVRLSPAAGIVTPKKGETLSARYDFSTALKNKAAWHPQLESVVHVRSGTFPAQPARKHPVPPFASLAEGRVRGRPVLVHTQSAGADGRTHGYFGAGGRRGGVPGSPRSPREPDVDADTLFRFHSKRDAVMAGANGGDEEGARGVAGRGARRHQRSYLDASGVGVRRTPPGTPLQAAGTSRLESFNVGAAVGDVDEDMTPCPSPGRSHSFPPFSATSSIIEGLTVDHWSSAPKILVAQSDDGNESTQSITSLSSSVSSPPNTPSPTSPLDFSSTTPMVRNDLGIDLDRSLTRSPVDSSNYDRFLNKFCFYTGKDALLNVPVDGMRRSHSASSVEDLLSPSGAALTLYEPAATHTRSSSFDAAVGLHAAFITSSPSGGGARP